MDDSYDNHPALHEFHQAIFAMLKCLVKIGRATECEKERFDVFVNYMDKYDDHMLSQYEEMITWEE